MSGAFYTVASSKGSPDKLVKLMAHFAERMRKRGYQLRAGSDRMSEAAMEAAVQEGHFIIPDGEGSHLLSVSADSPSTHQKAIRMIPGMVEMSESDRSLARVAVARTFGPETLAPSRMIVIWSADGAYSISTLTAATPKEIAFQVRVAELGNVPLLNLAHKPHRDKVIGMVKKSTKKSAMQQLAARKVRS